MTKIYSILFCLSSLFSFAQADRLYGVWIVDKIMYNNGNPMEVNAPEDYSPSLKFWFSENKMFFEQKILPIQIEGYTIKTTNSSKLNFDYLFQDEYLLLQLKGNNKIYALLKNEDFMKKYPLIQPNINEKLEVGDYQKANFMSHPFVTFDGGFPGFIRNFMMDIDIDLLLKNAKDGKYNFQFSCVLTKDHKITDLTFSEPISTKLKEKFIKYLFKNEHLFVNDTKADLPVHCVLPITLFTDSSLSQISESELKIGEIKRIGISYFEQNKFEEALAEYSKIYKIKDLDIKKYNLSDIYLRMGICYLIQNKKEDACKSFHKVGGISDLTVKNYLLNFCRN